MAIIKKGSTGSEVKRLQDLLKANGFSLESDGIFGSKTEAAVRDYQQRNNLKTDGIVGDNTWAALTPQQKVDTDWLARPVYAESPGVQGALSMLQSQERNKPGDYKSQYGDQIQAMLDKILNREGFSYDFNADPMYQQYADRFQQQGKMAMMDTMGNAAALSGGYGNSYAQTAGQQAYQQHLQGLNDVVPELRNAAYQMYQDEGNKMLTDVSLLQGMDDTDYGRYRDDVSDYYSDLQYYYNKYNDMSANEYNRYLADISAWENDRDFRYAQQQDAQAQSNWQAEFDLAARKAAGSGGRTSDGGGTPSNSPIASEQYSLQDAVDAIGTLFVQSGNKASTKKQATDYAREMLKSGYISTLVYEQLLSRIDQLAQGLSDRRF